MIKGICLLCEKAFSMQPATECVTLQFQLSSEKIDITDHISSLFYVEVDRVFTTWTILAHFLNKTSIPSYFFKADLAVLPEKKGRDYNRTKICTIFENALVQKRKPATVLNLCH